MYLSARPLIALLICMVIVGLVLPSVEAQTTYSVTVSITGIPSTLTTNVYVDGVFNTTMAGGQSSAFTFSISTNSHVITVDFYLPNSVGTNGTRYLVQDASWNFNASGTHVFTYRAQYYLTVQTTYSTSKGQGWYDSGTSVQAILNESEVDEAQGTREVFTGWSGDASGTDLTSNQMSMTAPKIAIANWKTQFYLTVTSDPPNLTGLSGNGWYDSASQANFSAAAVVPASDNSRLRFDHWGGDYVGPSATASITMDRPKTVKASYVAQYLLTVRYDPLSLSSQYNETRAGWYDAYANVQLGPAPSTIDVSSVERLNFIAWNVAGSKSSNLSYKVVMDQPHIITLSYRTQYYVDVRSSQGTVTGSGWYDSGSKVPINVYPPQNWPFSFTFTGWRLDPSTGNFTKTDDSWLLQVDRPYVVEAEWSFDYLPLIMIFGGVAVAIVGGAAAVVVRRRSAQSSFRYL